MPKKPVIPKRQSPNPKVNLRSAPLTSLLEQGLKLHRAGQLEAAAKIYEQIHAQQANHFDALQLLGSIAIKTKNYARAAELLKKAISIKPDFADAHFNFGIALKELKNTDAALHHYEKAIELKPDHANAYLNRGIILREMGRLDDALASYDQFISLKPDSAPGFNNRGIVLKQQKKIDEALASYNHAIRLDPNYADAYNNRAILLRGLNRTDEAMANFEIAASLKPDSAEFFNNRGVALSQQNRLDEAIEKYDKAISLKPDYAEAFQNRGDALTRLNQFAAAQESFQKAISLNPDYGFLPGRILHGKLFICDWSEFEIEATKTIEKIKKGEKASDPFVVLSITGCPLIHRKSSEIFTQSKFPPNHTLGEIPKRTPGEKIRVGYFSADFRSHAVSYLTAELFEIHDRTRFEIIAFSLQGARPNDPLWQRLTKAFDQFIEVTDKSDQEVAQLARDLKLDIAVDLGGFTQNSRTGIFAYRAAPIQINYLGFPGTMGSEYIDYIIADPVLIPPANQVHYTEKVIYLPDTYMVDDTNRQPSNRKFSKSELNLPEDRFIFCSLNNSYKFNQATLTIWAQILLTVKDSVLWLASHHAFFKNNLLNEFAKLNINPERIIFAERMDSIEDYLARYQLADLFLDTHPYNSHTTAVDALKAGLPILTLMGESFASRVAASLLSAIGLPELITTTPKDYQALAIELATQPEKLAALKQKLAENRLSMPLFNTPLFTKHLEMAYTQIMQRYWADLAPEHIEVQKYTDFIEPRLQPKKVTELISQAFTLHQQGNFKEAQLHYETVLKTQPNHFNVLQLLGTLLAQTNQFEEAVHYLNQALKIDPHYAEGYNNRGFALKRLGRLEEALPDYDKAVRIKPDYAEAHNNRGTALKELQRFNEALTSFTNAVTIKPDYADAQMNQANTLRDLDRFEEALSSYDKVIQLNPQNIHAHNNRGVVLKMLGRFKEAIASYEQAIAIQPDYADAYNNRGNALYRLRLFNEAMASYEQAIRIKPDHVNAYLNRGNVLQDLRRFEEALNSYDIAIRLDPNFAEIYNNRGNALKRLERTEEALISYDKAISIKPDYIGSYVNRGTTMTKHRCWPEALSDYQKAYAIDPDYDFLLGDLLHVKMWMCNWDDFDQQQRLLIKKVEAENVVSTPLPLLALNDAPSIHQRCATIYSQTEFPPNHTLGEIPKRTPGEKIRVGYFSADFRSHAVSYLTAELFEIHDRTRFEIIAFSLQGARPNDPLWQRLTKAFDQFIEVTDKSDQEVAQLARDLKLDIAVDLGGFTQNSRTGIFAYRAAPIQINYLGFPGTMGSEYIDYIIADPVLIPPANQVHYTEKVIYLPDTYMVDDTNRQPSNRKFSKSELNLPEDRFIFCSLNNSYKFNQATLTIWAQILLTVKDSVLWLASHHAFFKNNLLNEFAKLNINPERIIFAERMDSIEDYLARYQLADLFLDTHPYNSHTTAVDALKAGLPILTLMGESFASRVAASLLSAIGLPELITTTPKDYQALAIELATQPEKLAALKQKLAENRLSMPLFNTPLFTKHLEMAYTQIMQRYWADLAPEHIEVH